jgi:hypothetical protein
MISGTNDLSTHLLGNHQHKEDDENDLNCDEEEGCMPYDEEYEESRNQAATRTNRVISYYSSFTFFSSKLLAWPFTHLLFGF